VDPRPVTTEFRNPEELSLEERAIGAFLPDTLVESLSPFAPSDSPAGRCLGPYRLLDQIGQGGMGEIWRAEDTRLGRKVAVKLLPSGMARSSLSNARFLQEARAASTLDHPNICSIYEIGETPDHQLYLVMPCYKGEPLQKRIARGALPVTEALDLAGQVARGLGEAHRNRIIHRDIKPANLMITEDGTLKILDFGIAKLAGQEGLTRAGMVVGTLAYMSPEQLRGEPVDERTDLWSLGVVIYEMLAGRHPFPGEQAVVIRESILHGEPEPLRRIRPDVPVELDRLIAALLSKDPAVRIPSAESVAAVLRKIAAGASTSRREWLGRTAAVRWWWLGAGLLVLGFILAGVLTFSRQETVSRSRISASPAAAAVAPLAASERRPSVAVLGLQDPSADLSQQWLGAALTEMLTTELVAGGKFRVVSSESTARARHSLGGGERESLGQAYVERLHALLGVDLAVTGTYLPLGERGRRRIRLDIRILTMPTGDTVASVVESGTESELFDLVARAGSKLRNALGLPLPTATERRQVRGLLPVGSDAIHLYAEALARLRSYDPAGARDLLLRAESLEPSSVVIQSALSEAWMMLGQDTQARKTALRAFEGRHSLPQEAQLVIEARFHETGKQWSQASDIYHALQTLFPDELEYGLKLADTLSRAGRGYEALAVIGKLHEHPSPEGQDPRIGITEAAVAWRLGDLSRMDKAAEAAVISGRRIGSGVIVATGLLDRAYCASVAGEPQKAIELLRQSEELAFRSGDRFTAARADANLGDVLRQQGDLDGAEQAHERALTAALELGTAVGISNQFLVLGDFHQERGALQEARKFLEQALDWFHRIDYRALEAQAGASLASVYIAEGEPEKARHLLAEALSVSRSTRGIEGEIEALQGLAELKSSEAGLDEALQFEENALQRLIRLRRPALAARVLASSAGLLARTGNEFLARRRLTQAQAAGRRASDRLVSGHLLGTGAWFAFREGDLAASRRASEQQLHSGRQMHARPLEVAALRGLARIARAGGEIPRARALLAEAQGLAGKSGDYLTGTEISVELARLDLEQGALDSSLKLAREAAAWHHERHFVVDESAALALAAEALLRLGRHAEAREIAVRAQALAPESDHQLRLEIAPALARVEAAGNPDGALRTLGSASVEAEQIGFVPAAFEARLARGEILLRKGETAAGRAELERLREEAEAKGFLQVSRRAAALAAAQPRAAISAWCVSCPYLRSASSTFSFLTRSRLPEIFSAS
jgi:tetratricopeptide (TPR) repeat protein